MKSFQKQMQSLNQIKVPTIYLGNRKHLRTTKDYISPESSLSQSYMLPLSQNMLLISYSSPNLIHYS